MISWGTQVTDEALTGRQASISPHDLTQIQYTSGTTGFPKGVALTHYNVLNTAMLWTKRIGWQQGERYCCPSPFFHVAGYVSNVLGALCARGVLHPMLAFNSLKALQIIATEHCAYYGSVPTVLKAMLQHPDFHQYDLSSLKVIATGAAPVPVSLMEQVKEQIGANVAIAFGQTETASIITTTLLGDPFELKSATVGIPAAHTEVKIIDAVTGEIVPCGQSGELCCRGFQVMQGYYHMPERTAEAIESDGWLHTGDLAVMNARGYINIVGRLKEMVIRGGENLFPREIEEFLVRHPKVSEAQVVGVPDPFFGEELLAVVIPRAGVQISEDELRAYCKAQISHQKIPRYFQFVESYPMTASGKVQKFMLRDSAVKALGLESVAKVRTA